MRLFLVYQAGIANVFQVECYNLSPFGRNAKRLYQGDFRGAVQFARGAGAAGAMVATAACNMAGDVAHQHWKTNLDDQPFSDQLVNLRINLRGPASDPMQADA